MADAGYVSVGVDHDESALETLRRWWRETGQASYPGAARLLMTYAGSGSDSSRSHLWNVEMQCPAGEFGLRVSVCQFPLGTSKWNKIEGSSVTSPRTRGNAGR